MSEIITLSDDGLSMLNILEYSENVKANMLLLVHRLNKIQEFDPTDKSTFYDFLTYFDAILVQFRALLLENGNKQYTLQNYFIKQGKEEKAIQLNNYLDEPFSEYDKDIKDSGDKNYRTIRKVIKYLTDKYICHYDKIATDCVGSDTYLNSELTNPNGKRNINKIFKDILAIL